MSSFFYSVFIVHNSGECKNCNIKLKLNSKRSSSLNYLWSSQSILSIGGMIRNRTDRMITICSQRIKSGAVVTSIKYRTDMIMEFLALKIGNKIDIKTFLKNFIFFVSLEFLSLEFQLQN